MRALVMLVALSACGPGPGETRCSSTTLYGSTFMNCKQGPPIEIQPQPAQTSAAVAPQPMVFWCATRVRDGFGYCAMQPGECEDLRTSEFGGCSPLGWAICASSGCFTTAEACARIEHRAKRSAAACVLRR